MQVHTLPAVLAAAVVAVAVYTDLRYRRIPNRITLPALVAGLLLNGLADWPSGLVSALSGVGIALGLWAISLLLGGCMGAGDIKLLAAVGALCGARFLLAALYLAVLAGGVMAVVAAARSGQLLAVARRLWTTVALRFGFPVCPLDGGQSASLRIPYALPVAVGVAVCLLHPYTVRW